MISRPCSNCGEVKRCAMVKTPLGAEYLCRPCIRELGYDIPDHRVEGERA